MKTRLITKICSLSRFRFDAPRGQGVFGASWGEDGMIYFSQRSLGILKVPSGGGKPVLITKADDAKGEWHLLPQIVASGRAVIFTNVTAEEGRRRRLCSVA